MTLAGKKTIDVILEEIPYEPPAEFYARESEGGQHLGMLLESRRRDLAFGTKAIAVTKPGIHFIGTGREFAIRGYGDAGKSLLTTIAEGLKGTDGISLQCLDGEILGTVQASGLSLPEHLRLRQPGLGTVLRQLLSLFSINDPDAGFYGAFAYDYVRQGENIGNRFSSGGADVNLLLPFELVAFDELRGTATRKTYLFGDAKAEPISSPLTFGKAKARSVDLTDAQYLAGVESIIEQIAAGEMIQAVLSRTEKTGLIEPPFASYLRLATSNPSPYCFFYNMGGDEALFGASPEMHVRIQDGRAELRPLAGTRRRTGNAVDDYYVKLGLLTDEKEIREHVMLVDLARHDMSRVCNNVQVARFMDIVEFKNLYHIGSSIVGSLREGMDALDAILTTLPQGTLSGAPKVRAMQAIEELEASRRGYYGGCFGFFGFKGDCNTAIVIRSIYTSAGQGHARAGAGVVLLSKPDAELAEVNLKNENQMRALAGVR